MALIEAEWFRKLMRIEEDSIPADAAPTFEWTNVPGSWKAFVLIGGVALLVYVVFALYRREIDTCPRWAKLFLAGTRTLVIALLLIVFLGPSMTYTQTRTLQPQVLLLVDASHSMNTPDRYLKDEDAKLVAAATGQSLSEVQQERPSRVKLLNSLFERDDRKLLAELERRGKLVIGTFSNRVTRLQSRQPRTPETPDGAAAPVEKLPAFEADGQTTDLARVITDALSDKQTAAVVVVTDGQHTALEEPGPLAEKAKQQKVPLLILGVGDPEPPRNLVVADVTADPLVFIEDPFEIKATLRAQGVPAGTGVQVQLTERVIPETGGEPGPETVLERRTVAVPAAGGKIPPLVFAHTPKTSGRRLYNVKAVPIDNELSNDDNQPRSPVEVKVLRDRERVLLIAGSPTWEYRGLTRLLTRERSVDVSCWLQTIDDDRPQDGNTVIKGLPSTREELFKYDVIMLFDPNPAEFPAAWIELLKEFVSEHAGGLLYAAGPKFSGRFLADDRTKALRDVLPVSLGDVEAIDAALLLTSATRMWPLDVVPANVSQPIMRFYPDPQQSLDQWKQLPGIYWSYPVQEAKPATRVLIEHSDPSLRRVEGSRPLLVTGQFGAGRTTFVGFTGTWRWRRVGTNSEFFNRFWIQAVRYLFKGRSAEGKRRGTIDAERYSNQLGDRIKITADLKDNSYKPLEEPTVKALYQINGEDAGTVTLRKIANQPGAYQTVLTARKIGRHHLTVQLETASADVPIIETTFQVQVPSVETEEVWLNKPLLVDLADKSGGKYFDVNEVEKLAEAVPARQRTIEVKGTPLRLWDNWLVLGLLVLCLTVEWAFRKKYKLL